MVSFTHEQYIICSHSWTALRMSRLLLVSSYWQATFGGLSANEKEEKFASNDKKSNWIRFSCHLKDYADLGGC